MVIPHLKGYESRILQEALAAIERKRDRMRRRQLERDKRTRDWFLKFGGRHIGLFYNTGFALYWKQDENPTSGLYKGALLKLPVEEYNQPHQQLGQLPYHLQITGIEPFYKKNQLIVFELATPGYQPIFKFRLPPHYALYIARKEINMLSCHMEKVFLNGFCEDEFERLRRKGLM